MHAVPRETEIRATAPARQLTALIIDDDEQIQRLLRRIFGQCQYTVDSARTCGEARDKARTCTYDLAMVDVNLSDGSGLDLIEPLRKFSPHVEIISMSGDDPFLLEEATRKHGIAYNLLKPVDFQKLIALLRHIAKRAQSLYLETMPGGPHV